MSGLNLVDKGKKASNPKIREEVKELTKVKNIQFNFKNLVSTPKKKAWEWEEESGMFGKGFFE